MRIPLLVGPAALALAGSLATTGTAAADSTWKQPPAAISEVLLAPDLPVAFPSPTGTHVALLRPLRYPPIADLAKPMLRLAGVRVNPRTNGHHGASAWVDLTLVAVAGGSELAVELPPDARLTRFEWSADGTRFALLNEAADSVELWLGEAGSSRLRRVPDLQVNPLLSSELAWMPDQQTLLVKRVPPGRGPAPPPPPAPSGPIVKESAGRSGSSTYEARDLLEGPDDEPLFDHYAGSQLALVDAASGAITAVGEVGILARAEPSPDGRYLLVERLRKPWSYTHAFYRFPRDVEVLERDGQVVHLIARKPLADQVPIQGVEEGPRSHTWRQTEPATLVWLEALDGGDPGRKVAHRDRMLSRKAPFGDPPREIYRAEHRLRWWAWGERRGRLLVDEYERERRWRHVWVLDTDADSPAPRQIVDLSVNERYRDPGSPVLRRRSDGTQVLLEDGDFLYLKGDGATPAGDRPFLDRFSLASLESERLFRSDPTGYEYVVDWLSPERGSFLTRRESTTEVPNYFVRTLAGKRRKPAGTGEPGRESVARALTRFTDPTPELRAIGKRIVSYRRADGTPLSFTLYLPPGYREGTRLPTVLYAYPLEYSDPATAGQVAGSDRRFTRLLGPSHLFFLLDGYAVLDSVTMPVIGDPDTAYDTFIEQLVSSAGAALDKAVELGVTDPERVGVMGHSHGGLMTATLLAHSDLFRAGIARSGAYNHTMRPFGFQSERRTLWAATDTYVRLSPVLHAPKIDQPLLIVHGQLDQNPGTVPLQSEKLYEAVSGTGGVVRLVMLPHEQHGYRSREAVAHVLAEQLEWFDRHVKNAPPRAAEPAPVAEAAR